METRALYSCKMTDIRYDISQLFELAFGIKNPFFVTTPIRMGEQQNNIGYNASTKDVEHYYRYSWMGTPVEDPITILGGAYDVFDLRGELNPETFSNFELPYATLIDFSRAKDIIKTPISGNEGTVKELYAFGDWSIRIRGLCLTDGKRKSFATAREQKEHLLKLEQVADGIGVMGQPFAEKGIFNIIMEDINIQMMEGQPNVFKYEMSCVSDLAPELRNL